MENVSETLRVHAGLERSDNAVSISELLHQSRPIDEVANGVLKSLQQLNIAANGAKPSENNQHSPSFERRTAYAVNEIIWMLSEASRKNPHPEYRESAAKWCRRFQRAWLAILAGDIDDLEDHIAGEEWADGLS